MKTRAKLILTMTASALILSGAQTLSAATAPAHAPADQQSSDTIVHSTTKTILESINELSKTSSKLSEAALKLLESQEYIEGTKATPAGKQQTETQQPAQPAPVVRQTIAETEVTETFIPASEPTSPIIIRDTVYMTVRDTVFQTVTIFEDRPGVATGKPDLSEMTFWRGDSIPMALPTKRLGRYDRKLYNWLIYPKGLWHISLTANYGELNTEDMEILSVVNDMDLHGKIYSIKPSVSYFLRNNLCAGLRLAFTRGDMGINSFNVDIDEDMSFNLHDIRYTSDSYSAAVFLQQYFGLSRRGRFAVFNEVEMAVGQGNTHFIRPFDGKLRDTRTRSQSFNINYSPGVSIMMMKNAAFNLSFGIFGFHLKKEKQWEDAEESGSRFTSGINFRFNIFNINFGVSVII